MVEIMVYCRDARFEKPALIILELLFYIDQKVLLATKVKTLSGAWLYGKIKAVHLLIIVQAGNCCFQNCMPAISISH